MRGAAWILAFTVAAGAVVWLLVSRKGNAGNERMLADLTADIERGGIADLGRAQAVGRRLALANPRDRDAAARWAFANATLAADYGLETSRETADALARVGSTAPDGPGLGDRGGGAGARPAPRRRPRGGGARGRGGRRRGQRAAPSAVRARPRSGARRRSAGRRARARGRDHPGARVHGGARRLGRGRARSRRRQGRARDACRPCSRSRPRTCASRCCWTRPRSRWALPATVPPLTALPRRSLAAAGDRRDLHARAGGARAPRRRPRRRARPGRSRRRAGARRAAPAVARRARCSVSWARSIAPRPSRSARAGRWRPARRRWRGPTRRCRSGAAARARFPPAPGPPIPRCAC